MYCAPELTPSDRDLHRYVRRNKPDETLKDFRMTRLTFGVSMGIIATENHYCMGNDWSIYGRNRNHMPWLALSRS